MSSTSSTSHFHREFQALRTHLWYAHRFHLEGQRKDEIFHRTQCLLLCDNLQSIDNKRFRREIYPFLPNIITDVLITK